MAAANQNERILLSFDIGKLSPKSIKKAATIANSIMKTNKCLAIFNDELGINVEMKEKMKKVNIKYEKLEESEAKAYSWITTGSKSPKVIRVNKIFHDRLKHGQCNENEKHIIILLMSICIVHEVGHLIMQWNGFQNTPQKFGEAGVYIEKGLFNNLIRGLIYKDNANDEWDATKEFVGK
jgi:hypothetical protein